MKKKLIREFKTYRHVLINEKQVETVIKSLPKSWEYMMANVTHNESVKTFNDIICHLELELKRLVIVRPNEQVYVTKSSSRKNSSL